MRSLHAQSNPCICWLDAVSAERSELERSDDDDCGDGGSRNTNFFTMTRPLHQLIFYITFSLRGGASTGPTPEQKLNQKQ